MNTTERYRNDPVFRSKRLALCKKWRDANKEKVRNKKKLYAKTESYKEKARIRSARWRIKNREQAVLATKRWNDENPTRVLVNMKKYRLAKLRRCPRWLPEEKHEVIAALYATAREMSVATGTKYEVDHVYPLRGKLVSGLHVPLNLRIVLRFKNRSKHNRFEIT